MHARERMIRTRFAEHECADCGSHYLPASVVVLARRRSAWMVMASCPTCERRSLFVVTFPDQARPNAEPLSFEEPRVFPHSFLPFPTDLDLFPEDSSGELPPAPPPTQSRGATAVSESDVSAMRAFLAEFNGDFSALFAPRHRDQRDD